MGDTSVMEANVIEELRILVEAQGIDSEISEINRRKSAMPAMVERVQGPYDEAKAALDTAKANSERLEREKKTVEREIEDSKDLLVKLKHRSTEIKTNKEYFAHLKEIEDCEKRIKELEDRSLEIMEAAEELVSVLDKATGEFESARTAFDDEKKKVEESFSGDNARLAELGGVREDILAKLPAPLRREYNRLVDKYPDNAVARAEGGACTGCRMMIPPQAFNNVRKGEAVIACDNCKRILYYTGESD